jgi:Ca-activated chloride channel family protein
MKFAQPIWLLVGFIACAALFWRYRRFDARQRAELRKFASESLIAQLTGSVSAGRRRLKRALVVAGIACVAIALARPLIGFRWEETKRKGLDLLIALDTSKSMLAQDVKPDRLTRAKMAVEDLLGRLDGDRVGLIAFAGNAFLQCPLTLDYDAFLQSLDAIDTRTIARGGTDIASAIREAEAALETQGHNERILVLLTDGEDLEGSALEAARSAAKQGLKIFTVGVGTANGELIPLVDEKGETQFARDSSGQFVKSHLDESMLKQIAEATGGMYVPLGQQGQGLQTIYQKGLAPFTRHELTSRMHKVYTERYQWPLALGLLCLTLEPLTGIRRRKRVQPTPRIPRPALAPSWNRMARPTPVAATAVALTVLACAGSARASVSNGEKAFQKGDYSKAQQEYGQAAAKSPNKPVLQYNSGAAAYKAGNFDAAAQSFTKAMKTDDLKLQQDDYYNLGNAQYRIGQKTEKANAQETIKTWEEAVQSYEAALQLKVHDADAEYNRDFVKRKIEELKKQQQQQQQQQQNQQNQQNQNGKDNQNKDQNKQDQNQNKQQQQSGGSGQQNQQDKQNNHDQSQQDNQHNKDQNQPKDQQAKQDKQEQNKPNSGNGQREDKPSGQPDKQDQASKDARQQQNQQPEQARKDSQPQARNPQPNQAGHEQADARPEPGKMSREEAKQLLDSLKSDDRKMPLAPSARGNASARNDAPLKDW